MNVLFVGAHPDDIEVFSGGTAALYAARGDRVFFCVSTNGDKGSSTLSCEKIAAVRHQEAQNGANLIGAELIWLGYEDEFLLDSRETRLKFIEAIRLARPEVIICHWHNDYNPDHSISGMLVDECVSMAKVPNIRTASSATNCIPHVYYMDTIAGVNFDPEIYVDITSVFEKKIALVNQHVSQGQWMTDMLGYDLKTFLEIPARYRGLQASCPLAEAFRPYYRWGRTFDAHYMPKASGVKPVMK